MQVFIKSVGMGSNAQDLLGEAMMSRFISSSEAGSKLVRVWLPSVLGGKPEDVEISTSRKDSRIVVILSMKKEPNMVASLFMD